MEGIPRLKCAVFVFILSLQLIQTSRAFEFSSTDDTTRDSSYFGYGEMNKQFWVGADVGGSFKVTCAAKEYYVWIFGDTLVGQIVEHAQDCNRTWMGFPRNSIGVAEVAGEGPIKWFYGGNHTNSESFFKSPKEPDVWLWPVSGYYSESQNKIIIATSMEETDKKAAFGFKDLGSMFIYVADVCDGESLRDPRTWSWTASEIIPTTGPDTGLDMHQAIAPLPDGDDESVYLLGRKMPSSGTYYNVLARAKVDQIAKGNLDAIEYFSKGGAWTAGDASNLELLIDKGVAEATLQYHPYMKKWFILGNDFMSPKFYIRYASDVTGPWTDEIVIYQATKYVDPNHFMYAVKSHPECQTAQNQIVFSYNINSFSMSGTLDNCYVYIPKFVNVTIT